ncbi:LPS export ABC transporter periplasmic protein LptC [Henriciella barbarensis]|nr:LPS export ABC transporter periplasmic protein LptC [Henriciella barbarensis]
MLRLAFTAGAAIAAGIMVGHLAANAFTSGPGKIEQLTSEEVVTMVNARFTGRDETGSTIVITADTAQRQRDNPEQIALQNPRLVTEDGTEIDAPSGLYDQAAQTLALFEDVRLIDAQGYDFRSTSAKMFISEGRVDGIDPLVGSGPLGDVTCDTYEIVDDGDRLRCRGNVNMMIFPGGRDAQSNASAANTAPPVVDEE